MLHVILHEEVGGDRFSSGNDLVWKESGEFGRERQYQVEGREGGGDPLLIEVMMSKSTER